MLLSITKLDEHGDGIGIDQGQKIAVSLTIPGDVVEVATQDSHASLVKIIEPSSHRITPPCPYFGTCGGCRLQHLEPSFYKSYKQQQVKEILEAEGVRYPSIPEPVSVSPGTRRRVTLKAERIQGTVAIGFYQRQSHTLVPIKKCLLISDAMNAQLEPLRLLLKDMLPTKGKANIQMTETDTGMDMVLELPTDFSLVQHYDSMVDFARQTNIARLSVTGHGVIYMDRAPAIYIEKINLPTLADGFLQASPEGEQHLIYLLHQTLKGQKGLKILELFAGIGTFTLSLAQYGFVTAYEGSGDTVKILQGVSARHQLPVHAHVRDLFKKPLMVEELKPYDVIVLDPPRLGAIHQARQLAEAQHLSKIIYIACHPKTFARDARILQKGGWKITQLNLVDQFLWSQHMELFSVWEK